MTDPRTYHLRAEHVPDPDDAHAHRLQQAETLIEENYRLADDSIYEAYYEAFPDSDQPESGAIVQPGSDGESHVVFTNVRGLLAIARYIGSGPITFLDDDEIADRPQLLEGLV